MGRGPALGAAGEGLLAVRRDAWVPDVGDVLELGDGGVPGELVALVLRPAEEVGLDAVRAEEGEKPLSEVQNAN